MNDRTLATRWGMRLLVVVILLIYARFAIVESARDWDASDLAINYSAATLLRTGGSIYDWAALRQIHAERIGPPGVLYQALFVTYINPPTTALLFWPLALLPFADAKWIFVVINNALYLLAIVWLLRELSASSLAVITCVLVCLLGFYYPIRQSFGLGQMNGVLVAILVAAVIATLRRRDTWAGGLIGLAAAVKISPIVLLGFFIAQRRWRVWRGVALIATTLFVIMLATVSGDTLLYFVVTILPVVGRGSAAFPNQSLLGAIYRFSVPPSAMTTVAAMGDYPVARSIWLLLSAVIVLVTFWLVARARPTTPQQTAVTVSAWVVVGVLIGSLAWDHYVLWLTVPIMGLIVDWFNGRWLTGVIFWPLLSIALIAINLPIPYQAALYASLGPIGSSLSTWGMVLLLAVMNYRVWRIAQEQIEQPIAEDGPRANHAEAATSIE